MTEIENKLLNLQRQQIDRIDSALIDLLAQRFQVVCEVGKIKKAHNIDAYLPNRTQQVIDQCVAKGKQKGIDSDLIRTIWTEIINTAIIEEQKLFDSEHTPK